MATKSKAEKKPTGRPSKFSDQLFEEICERLSNGEPLRQICRDDHIPNATTVYNWLESDESLSQRFARAREKGFDAIAESALAIADEPPPTTQQGGTDSGHVAWAKNRVWTRLQLLAKWDPKRYGDKQQVEHSGSIGLANEIAQARARVKS